MTVRKEDSPFLAAGTRLEVRLGEGGLVPKTPARWILVFAMALCFTAACSEEKKAASAPPAPKAPAAPDPAAVAAKAQAKEIFASTCSPCHGVNGAANGPKSDGLVPLPRNFQDPAWQDSVNDAYIEKIIVLGGEAVGKSAAMPANPELADKPVVVQALRQYVRLLPAR